MVEYSGINKPPEATLLPIVLFSGWREWFQLPRLECFEAITRREWTRSSG